MKKFKIGLWVVIIGLLMIFIFQNQDYFKEQIALQIDLLVIDKITFPQVYNGVVFLASFLLGALVAYFYSLMGRYKSRKNLKEINHTVATQRDLITSLKDELNTAQSVTPPAPAPPETTAEPTPTAG